VSRGRLEPAGLEVEQGDDEDGEEEGAVDAGSVEEVGCGNKEDEVDGRSVLAVGDAQRCISIIVWPAAVKSMPGGVATYRKKRMGIQLRRQNMAAAMSRVSR
jgi:hypothetical protein